MSIIIDSTFRGTVDFLSSVVRIIAHVDAYYLHNHPHRTFLSIDSVSISVCHPVSLAIVREIADDESLEDGSSDDDDGNCDNNIDDDGDFDLYRPERIDLTLGIYSRRVAVYLNTDIII